MTARDCTERLLRRMYRLLLLSYSAAFRDDFGTDMEETFLDQCRPARSRGVASTVLFLAIAAADAVINGFRERIELPPWHQRSRMFHWQDVRYAVRLLRRSPLFTLLTVVVLSGGLGLSIFTFSFLHTAMLKPLPLGDGDRIVRIEETSAGAGGRVDAADLAIMRPAITRLSDIGAFTSRQLVVGDAGHRRVLGATSTEWNIFEVTRTHPSLGRGFRPEDQVAGAEPVVVLSHWAWQVVFGGDSGIVDARVGLNGISTRVIGVMPAGYGFPVAAEAWVPLPADVLTASEPGIHSVDLYGRMAAGASVREVTAEMRLLLDRARQSRSAHAGDEVAPAHIVVRSFPMAQIGDEGPLALSVLNLLAALILVLACINVTNLLLARVNERARETAVRLALGASRARLVMQCMWESVLLCLMGGALATGIAAWGLGAIDTWARRHLEGNLAFWWVWGLDRAALVAAGVFVTATIAVVGGVVSARATNVQFNAVLRDGGARSGGRREGRISRALVVTQVATVSVLMFFGVMSGIVAYRVANVDLGYETHNLLNATVGLPDEQYPTREKRGAFYQATYDAMRESPDVDGVLLRSPLAEIREREGRVALGLVDGQRAFSTEGPRAFVQAVLGPLGTLGVTSREGRFFDGRDDERGVSVAVVSQAFARKHWPAASPVGEQIRLVGLGEEGRSRTVVGVVSDVLLGNPLSRDRSAEAVYVPLRQVDAQGAIIVFKHRGDAPAAQTALMRTLADADPRMPPPEVSTFDEMLGKTALIARSVTKLFAFCFGFALLLAVSGTYGLMARSIGQRTREIGVRRALGASDRTVVQLLLGQGGRQLGIGVLFALPAMLAVGIGFWKFFPIELALSVGSGLLVSATIVSVVLIATYIPTRRVLKVTPRDALWRD